MSADMKSFLEETRMLDYSNSRVQSFAKKELQFTLSQKDKLVRLYSLVSKLRLGYSSNDTIPASKVIRDGFGQCNTKVTLLMALARLVGIPSRVHCYRITKEAQRGRVPDWIIRFAPQSTLFTWPEFFLNGSWQALQEIVHVQERAWNSCPFDGAAWQLEPLKKSWIVRDDGVWASQDEYFKTHKPSVHGWRKLGWHLVGRHVLNYHLKKSC